MDDFWLSMDNFINALREMKLEDYILDYEERRVIKYNKDHEKI